MPPVALGRLRWVLLYGIHSMPNLFSFVCLLTNDSTAVWNGADCLLLHKGPLNDDDEYLKSTVLHQWIFGYEIPDSVLLLRKDGHVWFMATKKKCDFIQPATTAGGAIPANSPIREIHLLKRNKGDADGVAALYDTLWKEAMADTTTGTATTNGEKRVFGVLTKERDVNLAGGGIVGPWETRLTTASEAQEATLVDVAGGVAFAMSVKDDAELDLMKKSSVLSNKVMKHGYVKKMEEVIDSEQPITHEELAGYVEDILEDPSKIALKVPKEDVQSCYVPIVQSGGTYDLKVSAESSANNLSNDIIIVSIGARYKQYCSSITRTFFVDPPKKVSEIYEVLLAVQEACLAVMKPGNQLKMVYQAAVTHLKSEPGCEYLIDRLPKSLGFCTGLDFRESAMLLTPKSQATFKRGMVFCLSVGFSDLDLSTADRSSVSDKSPVCSSIVFAALCSLLKLFVPMRLLICAISIVCLFYQVKMLSKYALLVADMVAITSDTPDVLTKMGKNVTDVAYNINEEGDNDEDDEEEDDDDDVDAPDAPEGDAEFARKLSKDRGGTRTSSRLAKDSAAQSDVQEGVAERERRQISLMGRRNEERLREMARSNRAAGGDSQKLQAEELQTYKRTRDYPDNVQPNQVKVDMANQCVILPICGNPVPFHISTIKNIVMPDDDTATLLRINFYTAGMAVGKDAPVNMAKLVAKYAPYASFIRELTFRSLDGHNLTLVRSF